MMSRPAIAALACRGCRSAILRAVLSSTTPSARSFAAHTPQRLLGSTRRLFSLDRQLGEKATPTADAALEQDGEDGEPDSNALSTASAEMSGAADKPWFLNVAPPRHAPTSHAPALPQAPDDAPALLGPTIKYVYEDMGLDELALLDLRELDPPAALGPNLMMLFGTARSERHLHIASGRFVRWLRRNYMVNAKADGLIGPGELKTKLRRLRKKAKLTGTNAMILPGGDNGISTGWVCVNFSTSGSDSGETSNFDESGRFSGFGATQTGTTVVVQCMTESRRGELDLETLWRGILRRSLEQGKKIRGENVDDKAELEALVSSRVQLPSSPAALQWQALGNASQQQRHFSTLARRLQAHRWKHTPNTNRDQGQQESEVPTAQKNAAAQGDLSRLRRQMIQIHASGAPLNLEALVSLISDVLQAAPSTADTASERLTLVDQLLLTAHERGLDVWSRDVLVSLIESVVKSPAYGPELQRAQENLELLLVETRTALDDRQVLRLMEAYAHVRDWDKMWDTFRSPARFGAPRSAEHYELAYRLMAGTGDVGMCTEALRWVYPEMLKEEPAVPLNNELYGALRNCILVADPEAENLLLNPPSLNRLSQRKMRVLVRREFMRVLKEVNIGREFNGIPQ